MNIRILKFAETHQWSESGLDKWDPTRENLAREFGVTVCTPDSVYYEGEEISSSSYPSRWTGAYGFVKTRRLRGRGARRAAKAVIYRFGNQLWRVVTRAAVESAARPTSKDVIIRMVGPDLNATRASFSQKCKQWDSWHKAIDSGRRCVYLRYYGTAAADNRCNGSVVIGEKVFSYAW